MAITAKDVKELREKTGSGMMDCKKALVETDGNMEEAIEWLRKKGLSKAEKKADRIAAEGIVVVDVDADGKKAAIVEVNSETDFVAKNEKFTSYVAEIAAQAKVTSAKDIDAFLAEPTLNDASKSIEEKNKEMIAVIGENLKIRRFEQMESAGLIVSYIHAGGKIGVLVNAETDAPENANVKQCLDMVAMQIASMNPKFLQRSDISSDKIDKEREVIIDSALNDPASLPKPILNKLIETAINDKLWSDDDIAIYNEKKSNMNYLFNFLSPEAVQTLRDLAMQGKETYLSDKIFNGLVEGRISKRLKEICLLDQGYVFGEDSKQTVAKYIDEVAKAEGCSLKVTGFVRFETGEGIEKKSEDFAAEVAAQMQG